VRNITETQTIQKYGCLIFLTVEPRVSWLFTTAVEEHNALSSRLKSKTFQKWVVCLVW